MTLVKGPVVERHTLASTLHAILSTTALLLRLPFHLVYHFVLFRSTSPLVQELGRSPLAETAAVLVRHIFLHLGVAPGRALFSVGMSLPSSWVTRANAGDVKAYWIAPPSSGGSSKKSDDLCLYWIHGESGFLSLSLRRAARLTACIPCRRRVHARHGGDVRARLRRAHQAPQRPRRQVLHLPPRLLCARLPLYLTPRAPAPLILQEPRSSTADSPPAQLSPRSTPTRRSSARSSPATATSSTSSASPSGASASAATRPAATSSPASSCTLRARASASSRPRTCARRQSSLVCVLESFAATRRRDS